MRRVFLKRCLKGCIVYMLLSDDTNADIDGLKANSPGMAHNDIPFVSGFYDEIENNEVKTAWGR